MPGTKQTKEPSPKQCKEKNHVTINAVIISLILKIKN